jgi:hypothetical protein
MDKRKIIEIYVTEDKENDTTTFDFDRLEDTKEANFMMKRLSLMFATNIKEDENLEICNGNE